MKSGKAASPLIFSPCRAVVRNSGTPRIAPNGKNEQNLGATGFATP